MYLHPLYTSSAITPKQYIGYFFNLDNISSTKQGIVILLKSHITHQRIIIKSYVQTPALKIKLNLNFTVINQCIPPCQLFTENDLTSIITIYSWQATKRGAHYGDQIKQLLEETKLKTLYLRRT